MKESILYQIPRAYLDDFRVRAFTFGMGEKALCLVGAMRGNEYQQLYMCSGMVQRLKKWETEGRLVPGKQVLVIPTANPTSMNIGKRFWSIDNTDINRMFPGYNQGETTQRIAAGVFEAVNKYRYGIQFTSFYMPGDYQPHVRMMHTGYEDVDSAVDFGLPYVVIREPKPYDTTTLNYNWQIWQTSAFSIYSNTTNRIDSDAAELVMDAIERFMIAKGLLKAAADGVAEDGTSAAPQVRVFAYEELITLKNTQAGFYKSLVPHNARVAAGQMLAEIISPVTGEVLETLTAPEDGVIFFQHNEPLIFAYTSAIKILKDQTA